MLTEDEALHCSHLLAVRLAGMDIICKAALNEGVSNYVLVVYRHAVATIVMAPFAIIWTSLYLPLHLNIYLMYSNA